MAHDRPPPQDREDRDDRGDRDERADGGSGPFALSVFPRRVAAYAIDVLILAILLGGLQAAISSLAFGGARPEWTRDGLKLEAFVILTMSLPSWIYFTLFESGVRRATPGKRLLRLKVTGLDGERLGFGTALLRTIIKLLPWELTHVGLLYPTPLWDDPNATLTRPLFMLSTFLVGSWLVTPLLTPEQQAPHDLVAKTVVVPAPRPA